MASQCISIAKIGGVSGQAVVAQFRRWAAARSPVLANEWSPEQWPESARNEMDAFAEGLRANGHRLPVVYFSEYVDMWSMGDVFDHWLVADEDHAHIHVTTNRQELWCYSLPDCGALVDSLRRATRSKRIEERDPQEYQWLRAKLLEATLAWENMVSDAAIVVLRTVFGGLVEDAQIMRSLNEVPPWLAATTDQVG